MKLLLILLLWSQGAYAANKNASAAASSLSAASEAKSTAAQARTRPQFIKMPADISTALAGWLSSVNSANAAAMSASTSVPFYIADQIASQAVNLKKIYQWLDANPNNVNAVLRNPLSNFDSGWSQIPLLILVIEFYSDRCDSVAPLLRKILSLKPNIRNEKIMPDGSSGTALGILCLIRPRKLIGSHLNMRSMVPPGTDEEHLGFVKEIIDLQIEQEMNPADIEVELKRLWDKVPTYAYEERVIEYKRNVITAALDYLHDIQAASLVEEEMTQKLGFPPELGGMTAEYLDPSYKKRKKHMHHHHRKSGDNGK